MKSRVSTPGEPTKPRIESATDRLRAEFRMVYAQELANARAAVKKVYADRTIQRSKANPCPPEGASPRR